MNVAVDSQWWRTRKITGRLGWLQMEMFFDKRHNFRKLLSHELIAWQEVFNVDTQHTLGSKERCFS